MESRLSMEKLCSEADKTLNLIKLMDNNFPENTEQHLKLAIMVAIQDAHREGWVQGKLSCLKKT